jgi:hypothetical protein
MAKFFVRGRQGPGDTYRKDSEIDAPTKPDGSHFRNVLDTHLRNVLDTHLRDNNELKSRQYIIQHAQSGECKPFNVSREIVVREG